MLAGLLIFTGAGAGLAGRFRLEPQQALQWILPLLLLTLLATAFLLPVLFSAALGLSLAWRVTLALIVLAPLGILLGMPFPTGLRLVSEEASALVPWCWGVNGFFTVIGTVTALMLGMSIGFKMVLVIAAICYVFAFAAVPRRRGQLKRAAASASSHE